MQKVIIMLSLIYSAAVMGHDLAYHDEHRRFILKKDGTSEDHKKYKIKILTKDGVEKYKKIEFSYSSSRTRIKKLKIKVRNEKETIALAKKDLVETSHTNSSSHSDIRTLSAIIPQIKIGSIIDVDMQSEEFFNPLGDKIESTLFFGLNYPELNGVLEIISEVPIKYRVNDLNNNFEITVKDQRYLKLIQNKEIVPEENEEDYRNFDPKNYNYISFSTAEGWSDLYQNIRRKNEEVQKSFNIFNVLSSKSRERILASKHLPVVDFARVVAKEIHNNYIYTGDYRSAQNHYWIQDINSLIKKGSGDCKFFSHLYKKVMEHYGYETQLGLVELSEYPTMVRDQFPYPIDFNHMMTFVKNKDDYIPVDITSFGNTEFYLHEDTVVDRLAYRMNKEDSLVEIDQKYLVPEGMDTKHVFSITDKGNVEIKDVRLYGDVKYIFDRGRSEGTEREREKFVKEFLDTKYTPNVEYSNNETRVYGVIKKSNNTLIEGGEYYSFGQLAELSESKNRKYDMMAKNIVRYEIKFVYPSSLELMNPPKEFEIDNEYLNAHIKISSEGENKVLEFVSHMKKKVIPVKNVREIAGQLEEYQLNFTDPFRPVFLKKELNLVTKKAN